jgi:hypothetical protein
MSSISRWQVKLGLILLWGITILTPLVLAPTSLTYGSDTGWQMDYMYMFIFGAYYPPGSADLSGWVINPMYLPYIFMLLLFFIIYPVLVTKYCLISTTQREAIIAGLISLAIPFLVVGISVPFEARLSGSYAGPLPLQFIMGLVVMQIVKRGIRSPKDDLLDENAWWEKNQTNSSVDKQ